MNELPKISNIPNKKNNKVLEIKIENNMKPWFPAHGVPDYFEKFKRLHHEYEMSNWDTVSKSLI